MLKDFHINLKFSNDIKVIAKIYLCLCFIWQPMSWPADDLLKIEEQTGLDKTTGKLGEI